MSCKPAGCLPLLLMLFFTIVKIDGIAQSNPTPIGFAHNDYKHKHPLFDALDNGFTNIEADVFLKDDKLVVGHFCPIFHYGRSLEKLYLRPLYNIAMRNNGRIYTNYDHPVILMIDFKTKAAGTYRKLEQVLQKYQGMLTHYENGRIVEGAVTVVVSGHKPYALLEGEPQRYAFIDEDLRHVDRDTSTRNVFTMASCKYSKLLSWNGIGPMPELQKERLLRFVAIAHHMGSKVRLWASPERKAVWDGLLSCGVDLINTDQLSTLHGYLSAHTVATGKVGSL
ncbi:MAG: phosphatidylinositol-specific phospholipase C/glycerophosphodiester phosphodiesterase family protein [Bacteroidetes bacterium]|nr:phosphatidylinositol-specific phospholipase C/glycerophosphodiester phosphodiesterase family protein [Bacteroidota bacterium]